MAVVDILFALFQILTLKVQSVGDELDEETREHMETRAEMLNREMTRLWLEIEETIQEQSSQEQTNQEQTNQEQTNQEEMNQEQSSFAWASLLFSALHHWQFWATAGVLVLLFGLCWYLRTRSREPEREEESSDSDMEEEEHEEQNNDANEAEEGSDDANEAEERNDGVNEAEEDNDDGNEAQEGNDDANEAEEQNDDANEAEEDNDDGNGAQEGNDDANEAQEENDDGNEADEENDDANDPGRFLEEHIQWPVQHLEKGCKTVRDLTEAFILIFQYFFSNTSFPVLDKAIEVGSAFEGWSPREEDITYRMLVPLKPPHGHIFHLEPGPGWPARNFRIRVELVCTCAQPAGETRCFLHNPEEEQRRNEGPSILEDLCTDSYLDVQKIALYFRLFVRRAWRAMPISAVRRLTVLPSDRSCKLLMTQRRGKKTLIELLFGVQEGNSDIFLSSQYTEALYTPSTVWPESYAVAEMKFFRHIASQAQPDSFHLRCLQLCVRSLLGRDFSTYTMKTVVMHLLNTTPLSDWHRRYFWDRLEDIMGYLQSCVEKKCLNHFFFGNENVPEEIILPLELRMAEPLNLFQHLAQNPDAHENAQFEFEELHRRLRELVLRGH